MGPVAFSSGIIALGAARGREYDRVSRRDARAHPALRGGSLVVHALAVGDGCALVEATRAAGTLAYRSTLGAATTGLVAIVIAATKFEHGAWMVIVLT